VHLSAVPKPKRNEGGVARRGGERTKPTFGKLKKNFLGSEIKQEGGKVSGVEEGQKVCLINSPK